MYNFRITFEYPWLLLLLIPALFFTVFHYFRSNKKYRRTRNRILSMVLHGLIMVLCISVFAGFAFRYEVPNEDNQIYLLVDMSDSGTEMDTRRDELVRDILDESRSHFNMGVVLFGYDQVLASELSSDPDEIYRRYMSAQLPDTSATDIAAALNYTKKLFTKPETSKIVLISDGLETDGDALTAVRSVAAEGILVDTVSLTRPETSEVEIVAVTTPDYNLTVGVSFSMTVSLRSSIVGEVVLTVLDNGENVGSLTVNTYAGSQDVVVYYTFNSPGMHSMTFEISNGSDKESRNNKYYSYINIAVFDRILVLERNAGEASQMVNILKDGTDYTVDVINVRTEAAKVPDSVNALRQYDEVVLFNISNADLQGEGMPEGFDEMLNIYVQEYGGGLFTVGGNDENGEINTYNRDDMVGTLYQDMLPVEAVNYTPPLGIIFLLDVSGSMDSEVAGTGKTRLELAVEATTACIQHSLSERDYCGIMALGDPPIEISPVLPVPRMSEIIASMNSLPQSMSGTPYNESVAAAGSALMSLTMVEKRHIIIISDAGPTDANGLNDYGPVIKNYADLGVTTTIVNISDDNAQAADMETAAALGNGRYIHISDLTELTEQMRTELEADEIIGITYETFTPTIRNHTSVVNGVTQDDMPTLDGYYGTKIKSEATTVLVGEYVPIYAQWRYGKGSVGSFMCDLSGNWSGEWLKSAAGQRILKNIALALFPTQDIRPKDIEVSLSPGNYSTVMSIFTDLNEGERIEAVYLTQDGSNVTTTPIEMNPDNGYTRATFVITEPGIHEVVVRKVDAMDNVLATSSVYRVFSYSAEYEILSGRDGLAFLAELAEKGKGSAVAESWEVFEGFEIVVHEVYDPRLIFCLIALICFLGDIAVRKFKFKWPHEIIRERREKKKKAR